MCSSRKYDSSRAPAIGLMSPFHAYKISKKSLNPHLISAKTTDLSLTCLSYPRLLSALFLSSSSPILNNLVFFPQISQALGLITLRKLLFFLSSLKSILLLTGLNSPSWLFMMFLQLLIWLTVATVPPSSGRS